MECSGAREVVATQQCECARCPWAVHWLIQCPRIFPQLQMSGAQVCSVPPAPHTWARGRAGVPRKPPSSGLDGQRLWTVTGPAWHLRTAKPPWKVGREGPAPSREAGPAVTQLPGSTAVCATPLPPHAALASPSIVRGYFPDGLHAVIYSLLGKWPYKRMGIRTPREAANTC